MADNTKITWTDGTINPIVGCKPVSPGCANCYAAEMAHRFKSKVPVYQDLTTEQGKWTGSIRFNPKVFKKLSKKGRLWFLCSMSDMFHEDVLDEWLNDIMDFVEMNPQHTFQILTKRPERMVEYFSQHDLPFNVWLGVTAENQEMAEERIPQLLRLDPTVAFVSIEPLLEAIDLSVIPNSNQLDWVIVGGEKAGRRSRQMSSKWVDSLANFCGNNDIAFYFKQWGTNPLIISEQFFQTDYSFSYCTDFPKVKAHGK